MKLTPKQEAFAQRVGTEGLSQTEAYKLTYDVSKSLPETIHNAASSLAAHSGVAARIAALRGAAQAEATRRAAYTLADAIKEAEQIRAAAFERGNMTAANAAATLKAKLAGHMIERKEVRTGNLEQTDVEDLEALLAELRARRAAKTGQAEVSDETNRPSVRPSIN